MFDIGFLELILIAIIGLLVLGPERLPVAARTLGRWIGKARRMAGQFSKEIDRQMELEELKEELKKQSENLDINEEARKIQDSVNAALKEAEEFEPLPRTEPDLPFSEIGKTNSTQSNQTQPTHSDSPNAQAAPDASEASLTANQDSIENIIPKENHSDSASKQ